MSAEALSKDKVLLIVATAPVIEQGRGLLLDVKFTEGMRAHCDLWDGPVRCVLRRGAQAIPFGAVYDASDLGFDLRVLDPEQPLGATELADVAVIFAAADDAQALDLVPVARAIGAKIVYSLEYTLQTRLQIVRLDHSRSWPRRLWSMLWNIRQERRRIAALRASDGVQANGYPAFDGYRDTNAATLLYLDGRMGPEMMATPAEMADRAQRQTSGAPLRLIHSGRLEPMKGAQDLLPVMRALKDIGVNATLDIYGSGSLRAEIEAGLAAFDGRVRLHDPVDFETELVPISRNQADVFLSCHRQSDPSCTYIEAMGCGLPVIGYDNRMWARMAQESGAGRVVAMGDPKALAEGIAAWDRDRNALINCAQKGLSFAKAHDFPSEFKARMDHLAGVNAAR